MISRSLIEELRDSWQTTEINVAREHVQHVVLAGLYALGGPEAPLAFKGGTALRILRGSPRFSADLDFTGWGKSAQIGRTLDAALAEASRAGLDFAIEESKATSTGWYAAATTRVHDWPVRIEWNVSLRKGRPAKSAVELVTTPLWSPYSVRALADRELVFEKIEALLRRGKARDVFDLYFILRRRLAVTEVARYEAKLRELIPRLNGRSLARELRDFLPRSHWKLLAELPRTLDRELARL